MTLKAASRILRQRQTGILLAVAKVGNRRNDLRPDIGATFDAGRDQSNNLLMHIAAACDERVLQFTQSHDFAPPIKPAAPASKRWARLVDGSFWFVEHYGRQAALAGWQTGDVFGVRPKGEGGLIDLLGTSRALVLDGKRARWRSFDVVMKFNAGAYPDLPAFWEQS